MYLAVDAQDNHQVQSAVKSECMLLRTYNIHLPPSQQSSSPPGSYDQLSIDILKHFHQIMLVEYQPQSVYGDGSCLYRTLSLGRFGTQCHHSHIRLLTTLEKAEHSEFYDTSSPKYKDLIKESAVVNDPYYNLLRAAYKSDGWS